MTFQQELASWNPFTQSHDVSPMPKIDEPAPSVAELHISANGNKSTIVAFLRHCGCPFAEKMFKSLRQAAEETSDVRFVAVSHSDQSATSNWLNALGGSGKVEMVVDYERRIYGAYGLGLHSFWHNLNPWSMTAMMNLGSSEQIKVRPTESGSRWQTAGLFGVGADGTIKYAHIAQAGDDLGDLKEALASVRQ